MEETSEKGFIFAAEPTASVPAYDLARAGRRALALGQMEKDYDCYMFRLLLSLFIMIDKSIYCFNASSYDNTDKRIR